MNFVKNNVGLIVYAVIYLSILVLFPDLKIWRKIVGSLLIFLAMALAATGAVVNNR